MEVTELCWNGQKYSREENIMDRFSASVYLWGEPGRLSLVSPESIALYWFLNKYSSEYKWIEIVFANNTDLSPNEELPLLIIRDRKWSGFTNIVSNLIKQQDNSNNNNNVEITLLKDGLLEFTGELCILTEYQMYLNKSNYELFTRAAFSRLLHWPMWYNTPRNYRAKARERCSCTLGYLMHDDDPDNLEALQLESIRLPQSKTLQAAEYRNLHNKEELQNAKHDLQYLTRLKQYLKTWSQVRNNLFDLDTVIPADFLLWANIFVQLGLPDGDKIQKEIENAINEEFYHFIKDNIYQMLSLEPRVFERSPTFQEQGNIIMSVYHYVHKFV